MPLGLYLSVPFCRTKCTYCNFASDVFSRTVFARYVDRVCADIHTTLQTAQRMGGVLESDVDSVYLGGGTPTILDSQQLERLFVTVRQEFRLLPETEITVECAPGTLTPELLDTLLRCGVNRVSLGVQSFVDQEAAAVGRLHRRSTVLDDIVRLRRAGISNINVDLIAGLPHQTAESWKTSVESVVALGVRHASVYMLEVDEDSRLGRELIAGGTKYHAHFVPDEELTADLYEAACERLNAAGIAQYEISNFAREGSESRHNLKYWTRQPYLGFGVDAHSMLRSSGKECEAVRFSTSDSLDQLVGGAGLNRTEISQAAALEEAFFLGLRLNEGVDLEKMRAEFGTFVLTPLRDVLVELAGAGLLEWESDLVRLTARGRLLSNNVFERFLGCAGTGNSAVPAGRNARRSIV
jgi:oxygen-independent coproporphyrinogen III oxidase